MKPNTEDFNALVGRVMASGRLAQMRPVVEKELLHYDILYCLDQANLLDELVFQGGTALRLCYGSHGYKTASYRHQISPMARVSSARYVTSHR